VDVVIENRDLVFSGFWLTIQLFAISAVLSLVLGALLAAARVGPIATLRGAALVWITAVRNTPLLIVCIFVFVAMPRIDLNFPFLVKGWIAVTVYTAPFVCEALRSGINAVPVGQAEAARAIGFTFGQTMTNVVLPQALRASVPPLASVQIAMLKNTTVVGAFGLAEAFARMRGMTNNFAGARPEIFVTFALGFIVLVAILSFLANRLEKRWTVAR